MLYNLKCMWESMEFLEYKDYVRRQAAASLHVLGGEIKFREVQEEMKALMKGSQGNGVRM